MKREHNWRFPRAVLLSLTLSGLLLVRAAGSDSSGRTSGLADLNFEDLLHVKVTSVSKRPEELFRAAAAAYVVTSEDLQRQGVTSIADALRTVPGMQVARINSHTWGVTARGFNAEYSNKLLVLNDGRSVYTPLNAGVYWDAQDMILEDLDRIEIIRGPGATLWGANAVNGVVNIVSKSAKDTQGVMVSGGAGSEDPGFGAVRIGGKLSDDAWYRVYAKYNDHDSTVFADGSDGEDRWWMARGGFRVDWEAANQNLLTFQGEVYGGQYEWLYAEPIPDPPYIGHSQDSHDLFGANLLARWTRTFEDGSEIKLQTYYDHTDRESNLPRERRDTFDVDFQHRCMWLPRQVAVWGAGYRISRDDIENGYGVSYDPSHETLHLFNVFVQDEFALAPDRLRFTVGTKFEHNDYTGFEIQPSSRLAWTPTKRQTVWASVSRAVRTPSRSEQSVRINNVSDSPGDVFSYFGDGDGKSEELLAYELGWRTQLRSNLTFDVTGFYNVYNNLHGLESGPQGQEMDPQPMDPPIPLASFYSVNSIEGNTWGAEFAGEWRVTDHWRLRSSYTWLCIDLDSKWGTDPSVIVPLLEGNAPENQFSLQSFLDLPGRVTFDVGLRYVDRLSNPDVPAYLEMDARLSWRPSPSMEISISGQNLLDDRHPELVPTVVITPPREVQRSVYGKVTWHF